MYKTDFNEKMLHFSDGRHDALSPHSG